MLLEQPIRTYNKELEISGEIATMQTTILKYKNLYCIEIQKMETWGDLMSLRLQWKLPGTGGDRDETIIISKCSKLAQKEYKTRHDWTGKVIHWEICKKFKSDHTNKWYMHNLAPVLENDT